MTIAPSSTEQALALRSVPVPGFLAELGVKFAFDEAANARLVLIPKEVSERVNVIDPVTSLCQADPNWTPRISVAHLDPDPNKGHFYKQAGNKLAPTKQALEILGKAAGILYTKTARVPRAELDDGEIGYRATLGVRRSDGTVEEISREKIWVSEAERAEIEEAVTRSEEWKDGKPVRGSHKFGLKGDPEWDAEVQKRWLKELKDRSAKTESKAVLRAIRSALQMPHTFDQASAAKPFLIVGFNFTPDYNDADTKRALVAAGLNASTAMYGPPALEASHQGSAGVLPSMVAESPQASEAPLSASEAPGNTSTDPEGSEAGKQGYNPPADVMAQLAVEAGKFLPPNSVHGEAGRTLADILALGTDGRSWFGMALRAVTEPAQYVDALWAFASFHLPELAAEVQAERATEL